MVLSEKFRVSDDECLGYVVGEWSRRNKRQEDFLQKPSNCRTQQQALEEEHQSLADFSRLSTAASTDTLRPPGVLGNSGLNTAISSQSDLLGQGSTMSPFPSGFSSSLMRSTPSPECPGWPRFSEEGHGAVGPDGGVGRVVFDGAAPSRPASKVSCVGETSGLDGALPPIAQGRSQWEPSPMVGPSPIMRSRGSYSLTAAGGAKQTETMKKRDNSVHCIRVEALSRHDTMPCAQTGRRSKVAQDERIRVYVYLPASGTKAAIWVNPDLAIGPPDPEAGEKNCMTELWGKDYAERGPCAGRGERTLAASCEWPEQGKRGPFADLLGLPLDPSKARQQQGSVEGLPQHLSPSLSPPPPLSVRASWRPVSPGWLLRSRAAFSPQVLRSIEEPGGGPSGSALTGVRAAVAAWRTQEARLALRNAVGVTPMERFRLAGRVVLAEVREAGRIREADDGPTSLKKMINQILGIPVEEQLLLIDKRQVTAHDTSLREYGIGHGTTVTLLVRKRPKVGGEKGRQKDQQPHFLASTAAKNQQLHSSSFVAGRIKHQRRRLRAHNTEALVMPKWQHEKLPNIIGKISGNRGDTCRFAEKAPYVKDFEYIKDEGRGRVDQIRARLINTPWLGGMKR